MAHTVMKQIFSEEKQKYIQCEVLVLDEEENLPGTDRREILLSCDEDGEPYTELSDSSTADIGDAYPETELIDQYEDFDNRQ
ncbi:MAG: hypothetical protein A2Y25_11045 [Candidatus Melainabacteria bacterium GWF2_37_15]|nr:MAG: hypothetical protein A2Y25_11045 [Candidatus Melainabacteria bacterium GWF2_37_15]